MGILCSAAVFAALCGIIALAFGIITVMWNEII